MMKSKVSSLFFIFLLAASASLTAQVPNPTTTQASPCGVGADGAGGVGFH